MNVYEKLGVRTFINGIATLTMHGGSIMPLEVVDAMREASQYFVTVPELQKAVGAHLAKLTHNESAFISDGAAAGMTLAAAAIIAGADDKRRMQLPDSQGMKNEILVCRTFNPQYSHAIRIGGGKISEYGRKEGTTVAELEAAISDQTAAIFYFYNDDLKDIVPTIAQTSAVAKKYNVPVVVDAAAQIPPIENLWKFTQEGADLAIFSGGKGIRGPQASGLIVGKKAIIDIIATYACPNGGVGRPLKVGKEEIIGLMVAIEKCLEMGTEKELALYTSRVATILDALAGVDAVSLDKTETTDVGKPFPTALIKIIPGKLCLSAEQVIDVLKEGKPSIYLGRNEDTLLVNPQCLLEGEDKIIADALLKIFAENKI